MLFACQQENDPNSRKIYHLDEEIGVTGNYKGYKKKIIQSDNFFGEDIVEKREKKLITYSNKGTYILIEEEKQGWNELIDNYDDEFTTTKTTISLNANNKPSFKSITSPSFTERTEYHYDNNPDTVKATTIRKTKEGKNIISYSTYYFDKGLIKKIEIINTNSSITKEYEYDNKNNPNKSVKFLQNIFIPYFANNNIKQEKIRLKNSHYTIDIINDFEYGYNEKNYPEYLSLKTTFIRDNNKNTSESFKNFKYRYRLDV